MSKRLKVVIIVLLVVIIALLVFLIIKLTGSNNNTIIIPTATTTISASISPAPPYSPADFTGTPQSTTIIMLIWQDNSSDEEGFIIYRNSVEITKTSPDVTTYSDTGLAASTSYQYTIKAYNQAGASGTVSCTAKTLNPPVTIRLDKIGVYDNRDDVLRGESGEVYVFVIVNDKKSDLVKLRFPPAEADYYKLKKDTSIDVNTTIFTADDVGDKLTLTFIGYENDGEGFEALAYKALEIAIEAQAGGAAGSLLELFDINLSEIIGQLLGEADDRLGSYERTWDINDNWGAGQYTDIVCKDENGVDCLRLWFTIIGG